jgi:hypothetical protein
VINKQKKKRACAPNKKFNLALDFYVRYRFKVISQAHRGNDMTNKESKESKPEEIDQSKVQAERKQKIKDILNKLSPTKKDKAYASLNGEQRFEEILISRYFNNNDDIAAILIDIDNQRKSEVQTAKQAQKKAEAEAKLAREKLTADMARIPAILKNDFSLNEVHVAEIIKIINRQDISVSIGAKEYLIIDILPAHKIKPVSFDTLKEALNNYVGSYFSNAPINSVVNKWIGIDGKDMNLLYDADIYRMTKTKTEIIKKDKKNTFYETICLSPIAITKKQDNIEDGTVHYQAEFYDEDGVLKKIILPKDEILSQNGMKKLSHIGLTVGEKKHGELAALMFELIDKNRHIPKEKMYNSFGWKDDCSKFFIGVAIYTLDKSGSFVSKSGASLSKAEQYEKYVKALIPHGTVKGWFEGNKLLLKYQQARFAVYEGIASILNYPLAQQSRMSNIWDTSSSGKSTIVCLVLSMFGYPGVKSGGKGLLYSGDTTSSSFEDFAKLMMDIVVSIDETKLMKQEELTKLMLKYGNQMVRGRSTTGGGMRKESQSWRGNCLATSESPIHAQNALEGEMIRAYDFNDSLGEITEESLAAVEAFEATEKIHYGQVGLVII